MPTTINVTHDQREALVVSDEIIVKEPRAHPAKGAAGSHLSPAEECLRCQLHWRHQLCRWRRRASKASGSSSNTPVSPAGPATAFVHGECPARGALRAEQIRIASDREALGDADTVFEGTVTDAIFEGERVVYEVAVAGLGGTTLRGARPRSRGPQPV